MFDRHQELVRALAEPHVDLYATSALFDVRLVLAPRHVDTRPRHHTSAHAQPARAVYP